MTCPEIAELSTLYLSGELDLPCAREFENHVGVCPVCGRELEQQTMLDDALRSFPARSTLAVSMTRSANRSHSHKRRQRRQIDSGRSKCVGWQRPALRRRWPLRFWHIAFRSEPRSQPCMPTPRGTTDT